MPVLAYTYNLMKMLQKKQKIKKPPDKEWF